MQNITEGDRILIMNRLNVQQYLLPQGLPTSEYKESSDLCKRVGMLWATTCGQTTIALWQREALSNYLERSSFEMVKSIAGIVSEVFSIRFSSF